jgi:hypothetical protein
VTLTTEEIDEDIYAFTGARARRRPRRRPRPVQRQLDVSATADPPYFPCTAALIQGPVRNFRSTAAPADAIPRLVAVGDHRRDLPGARRPLRRRGPRSSRRRSDRQQAPSPRKQERIRKAKLTNQNLLYYSFLTRSFSVLFCW